MEAAQLRGRAKGPRVFDRAAATLPGDGSEPAGWPRYLLVRRALTRNARDEHELACYLCCAPGGTSDEELGSTAASRLTASGWNTRSKSSRLPVAMMSMLRAHSAAVPLSVLAVMTPPLRPGPAHLIG